MSDDAAERAVGPSAQKSGADEMGQHVGARRRIEAPQPAGLRQGERQSRHLAELSAHAFGNQGLRVLAREARTSWTH